MLDMYSKYIVWYIVIGVFHFLVRYGVTFRIITKYNKFPFNYNLRVKWGNLIFLQGIFWPIGFILRIVEKISKIGV